MRRLPVILLTALTMACASAGGSGTVRQAELELVQLVGPEELNFPSGDIEVQYGIRIANRSDLAITLRQIQLESVTQGGSYQLESDTYYFQLTIEPEGQRNVAFWVQAYAEGDRQAIDARAPITIRGIAYFESPGGNFRRVFVQRLVQGAGSSGW